jgi:hypothetical protein
VPCSPAPYAAVQPLVAASYSMGAIGLQLNLDCGWVRRFARPTFADELLVKATSRISVMDGTPTPTCPVHAGITAPEAPAYTAAAPNEITPNDLTWLHRQAMEPPRKPVQNRGQSGLFRSESGKQMGRVR